MPPNDEITQEDLTSDVAVITGASSGIGRATALEFARQGYYVVLTARRQQELQQVAGECEQLGVRTLVVPADVTDEPALQAVADAAVETFGHIDVWVNDAAVSVYAKFLDTPVKDFRRVLDTNIMGYVHGARAALARFRDQGYGTLINISSTNAVAPVPYSSAYIASKYAVRGLTESIRMELEAEDLADSIQVCAVMPASMDTNFFQNAANYMGREAQAVEPVYDPTYVAKRVVALANEPRNEIMVGQAGMLLALQRLLAPNLYQKTVSKFVSLNNFNRKPADRTDGNLYRPVEANSGMRGGWRDRRVNAERLNLAAGGVAAGLLAAVGIGFLMARRGRD